MMAAFTKRIVATTNPSIYSLFSRSILTSRRSAPTAACTRVLGNADLTDKNSSHAAGRHHHNKVLPNRWGNFLDSHGRFKYWRVLTGLVIMNQRLSRDEKIEVYVNLLADVLGSVDEAKKRIHSVSTIHFHHFVCDVSVEIAAKIAEKNPEVAVQPLSDSDVERTDYMKTGEPFINGKAVPYDPKYHKALLEAYLPNPHVSRARRVRFWKKKKQALAEKYAQPRTE